MIPMEGRIHGVEDILLGFGPKDAGSIPAGSVYEIIFAQLFNFEKKGIVAVRHRCL
jgi:hypothetical protein